MTFQSTELSTDTEIEDAEQTLATLEKAAQLQQDEERPDWLPEGFDTVEDFVNDYKSLKAGVTPEGGTESPEPEDDPEGEDETTEADEEVEQQAEGIDFEGLTTEYLEAGALSDESYEKLEALGLPRDVVDVHIAGIEAQAELTRIRAAEAVGGDDNLQAVLAWAGQALPEKEIDRINALVAQSDFDGYLTALQGIKARYEASNGSLDAPAIMGGTAATSADIYDSQEEMKADMRDPRYARDEAFRAKVAAKVARTRRAS